MVTGRGRGSRARGGRVPSGPWGRLKPVNMDPLESYGLPSKGDNRLLDFKTQERYYNKIVERYMQFCSQAGRGDELLRRFGSLNLNSNDSSEPSLPAASATTSASSTEAIDATTAAVLSQNDLSVLMMALRKLREGIVASKRVDDFSIQVYIFCVRLSILAKHMESYQPAILHLLRIMHSVKPLSHLELQEIAGYLILDQACRQQDLSEAYASRKHYKVRDPKIDATLTALAHDNYHLFWKVKLSVDAHKAKLMEFAEDSIRLQALKCLGRTYMAVDLPYLERVTDRKWDTLVSDNQLGWQLEGSKVIIRKPKTR